MDGTIYCLVDTGGKVYGDDLAESHADLAAHFALNESECQKYRFDVVDRRLLGDQATPPSTAVAAQAFLNQRVGTAERLMQFAGEGHLSKDVLARLLDVESRRPYLAACAAIERQYTEKCGCEHPCLESGCSIDRAAGEACLQPLLHAGAEYQKACAAEWVDSFRSPQNRIDVWKN